MSELLICETFEKSKLDSRLNWLNPPEKWSIDTASSSLIVQPKAKTDYWQKTYYGFATDNGHFLFAEIEDNVVMTTQVRFSPVHQYDQAGLMVRISPQCWLKACAEYEPDIPSKLGVVVTNFGYSDWSTQDIPPDLNEFLLRISRKGNDYIVEYRENDTKPGGEKNGNWTQIRMAHLHDRSNSAPVKGGLFACSPKGGGYVAKFDFLRIERR